MKKRILIVDDEVEILQVCRQVLEKNGFMVELAGTGEEGLDKARSIGFDLILLDLVMPGMDGIEILRTLRAEGVDAKVCIITGFEEKYRNDLRQLADEGFEFELLKKPFAITQLTTLTAGMVASDDLPEAGSEDESR